MRIRSRPGSGPRWSTTRPAGCAEILRQKAAGRSELSQKDLRRVVARASKRFGDSQLAQASNQIAADTMPKNAARHGYSDADMDQFDLPDDAASYAFHPCVIDSIPIRGVGDPVYPFRRG